MTCESVMDWLLMAVSGNCGVRGAASMGLGGEHAKP